MTNTLEDLQKRVSEINIQVAELEKDIKLSAEEKKEKADSLNNEVDELFRQIDKELTELKANLKDETDLDAQEKIEKLEASKEILQQTRDLANSIILSLKDSKGRKADEKGFFNSIGDRFTEKRTNFKNKDNKEKGKTVGLVAVGGIATRGLFSFFSKEKREARKERRRQKREARKAAKEKRKEEKNKLPFWDRPIGKFIKWTGIGTAAYYISHGITTGKWKMKDFFDWKKASPVSSSEEALDEYTEFSHENIEDYEKYESIGENINSMYDKIRETEKQYFGTDSQIVLGEIGDRAKEQKLQKNEKFENIGTLGLVPYSLDNFYGNIGELLSYGGVNKYLRSKNIEEYKQKIRGFGADWFCRALVPYLSKFENFASFKIVKTDTAEEKMNKYFNGISKNAGENLEILDLFFRQYTKVLTYMADKKNALAQKCAREILVAKGYEGKIWPTDPEDQEEMVSKAVNDSDWVEENLKNTKYGEFLQGKIVGAFEILKEESLDNNEMTDELQEIIDGVDKQTEKIIGSFDNNAFTKAELKINNGESLDDEDKNELRDVSQNLLKDLGNTTTGSRMFDTFDYAFELLGLEEAQRQTILQESGLTKCLGDTVEAINMLTSEIQANPTKENVEKLKNLVGEYTSMKKELAVAIYAMNEAKENKDLGNYLGAFFGSIGKFYEHFYKSTKELFKGKCSIGNFINIFAGITVTGSALSIGGRVVNCPLLHITGEYMKQVGLFPATLTEMGLAQTRRGWAVKQRINTVSKTNVTGAENLMKKKILKGILSKRQVASLVQENGLMRSSLRLTGYQSNDRIFGEIVNNIFGEKLKEEAELFIRYYPKARGLATYKNESIRNGGWTSRKFRIDPEGIKKSFEPLKSFDVEFKKLLNNSVQKSYFEFMLDKVRGIDDMVVLNDLIKDKNFLSMIREENLSALKKIKIKQIGKIRELGLLDDLVNGKPIDEVLKNLTKLDTKIRRAFSRNIDKVIGRLNEVGNPRAVQVHIKNLNALKRDASLANDEMEGFIKFIDHGFDGKLLPDLKRLFKISSVVEDGEQLGIKMKRLISEGNFDEFKRILGDVKYKGVFKGIPVDDLVKNLDSVIGKLGKATSNAVKSAIKGFMKILAKVL